MELLVKKFSELTTIQLYEILKSRAEVFLLEQGIVCQDMDDVDYISTHYFFEDDGRVVAYLRAFWDKEERDVINIGRVLTLEHGKGIGMELMQKSIEEIKKDKKCKNIRLHAQKYACGFYEKLGFSVISDEFLEEGVVHKTMQL